MQEVESQVTYVGTLIGAALVASVAFAAPLGAAPIAPQLSIAPDTLVVEAKLKKKIYRPAPAKKPAVAPAGPQCVASVQREGGQHAIQSFAEASARNAWQRAVRSQYGERYLNLAIAKNANLNCVPSTTGLLKLFRCTETAEPCKPAGA